MKRGRAWIAAAALAMALVSASGCYTQMMSGGVDAPPNLSGFTVTFYNDSCSVSNVRCTGTVIAPGWVLTAAHCVDSGVGVGTMAGTGDDSSFCMYKSKVTQVTKYPCYTSGGAEYDIAVAQLDAPLPNTGPLPSFATIDVAPGQSVTLAGRGEGSNGYLKSVNLTVQADSACSAAFGTQFQPYMHCAGNTSVNAGYGKGDSGGPALTGSTTTGWILTGVAALGGPNSSGYYSVFTSIAPSTPYPQWIQNQMNGNPISPLCP